MNKVQSAFLKFIKRKESLLFFVLLIVCLSLFGWLTGKTSLASYSLQFIPIAFSTIAMFLALSILLLIIIKHDTSKFIKSFAAFFIIILAIFCSIILLEFLFHFPSEVENIFIRNPEMFESVLLGRMSPITALLFIFICVSLLSSRQKSLPAIKYIGGTCSLFVFLISFVLLIGYLYKEPLLYGGQIIPVSLPTAICFFLFSITLLRVNVLQFWTFNLIKDNTVALQLLKSFLPIVIFAVIAQGFLITNFPIEHNSKILGVVIVLFVFITTVVYAAIKTSMTLGDKLLRAEKATKESEIKYGNIIENVGEGIGFTNLDEEFILTNSALLLKIFLAHLPCSETLQRKNRQRHYREKTGRKLKEREKQLLRLNEDKDRFISILGHDLKNPFNIILGYSEVLLEDIRKLNFEEIEDYVNKIYKSAKNTNKLLDDILLWARTQQGSIPFRPQNLSFADIVKNVFEVLKPNAYEKNISINYSADHVNVYADADMLKTILLNGLSNAIKFTNTGGNIAVNAKQNGDKTFISVSDNGVGISHENQAKLFDISEVLTTKGTTNETGSGLGLLLCKEFVEKHRGKLWIESEEGIGSTFYFTLPHQPEPIAKQAGGNSLIVG
jgi:signal transduction histidine kinase